MFADVIRMRSWWIRVCSKFSDWCPYERATGRRRTRRHSGTMLCVRETDWKDAALSQEVPKTAGNGQNVGEEQKLHRKPTLLIS